ncbi:MAG TPA: acyl-CoA dehydrogenase family protein [Pseudonocardiaceae bacterium]|jgi:alkylation response protein AidB-like acyl-CoA dehydrogenase|nr:acyl-CoA dehydrogenase family protein [Pseudonocardiaceae bacterium]
MALLADAAVRVDSPARAGFREFVDELVAPGAGEFERAEAIPADVLARVAERGYFGAVLPVPAGGSGMDMVTLGELHEEIGRGCSSLRSLLTVHTMVAATVRRWAGRPARERWLPGLATGELRGSFCLSEPGAGSDLNAIAATAVRDGSDYVLEGTKTWITGGQTAALLLVFARTEAGLTGFLVEADRPEVVRTPVRNMLGTKASMLAEIRFAGARVPEWARVGAEGAGRMVATGALDLGRYSVAAGCVGILQACLDASVEHTAHREQGGARLREHQLVRALVSDTVTSLHAARALVRQAGELKDQGDPATLMATWIAKYFASTAAMRAATDAVQLHGALGCADGHPVNRYFRDAKVMEIIEGSSQIQQLTIAEHAYQQRGERLAATRGTGER